jgi:putative mycofactocin binding protein MftB
VASTSPDADRPGFDLDAPWRLHPQVAVRPESFGALLYHFGTRRLSFLKSPAMAEVVKSLGDHDSARSACLAAGVAPVALPTYEKTLAVLAGSSMICAREPGAERTPA